MDSLSIMVLLLIAFLAWSQAIEWLFWIILFVIIVTAKSIPLAIFILAIVGGMWYLNLRQYWFIALIAIAAIVLVMSRKHKGAGSEMYSPELMKLLGGGME